MKKEIAIIGMAGMFPEAESLNAFFENLCQGRDSVRPFSRRRLANTNIPVGNYPPIAFIEDIDHFDHEFFGISLAEAEMMDPRQRLLLQIVYQCIENAGYSQRELQGSRTSVFIGDTQLDYYKHADSFDPMLVTGNMNSATAGRISRFFNLRSSAEMIDTACSSSLVAVHRACLDLIQHESDYSIVGGVRLMLFPGESNSEQRLEIESPGGRCKTFSKDADGIGNGEAVVSILLKRYDEAIRDRDHIYAIIKSTAVNQDAALSASLTSPNSVAQSEVIKSAWEKAGIKPETITFIEAHGTGTKIGDPIEIDGINDAFAQYTTKRKFCAISSVKTNIGHTDAAAGITGLVKAVLSLYAKTLFPSLHFSQPNPFINFDEAAVYVNTVYKPWPSGNEPRRAGVSSFSLVGTNCHCVLEEAPTFDDVAAEEKYPDAHVILLSAKSPEALRHNITELQAHLVDSATPLSLADVSHTLACGRSHFKYRFSCTADDVNELKTKLAKELVHENTASDHPLRVVAAFSSGSTISGTLAQFFLDHFKSFKSAYNECLSVASSFASESSEFRHFAFQYSYYTLLSSIGLKTKEMIGDGVGKTVIDVITGKLSLANAITLLPDQSETDAQKLLQKLKLLSKTFNNEPVLFVEMGQLGNLTHSFQTLYTEFPFAKVVALGETKSKFSNVLAQLYKFGLNIEWDQIPNCRIGRKTPLPLYRFKKTRCWIKAPSALSENSHGEYLHKLVWEPDEVSKNLPSLKKKVLVILADRSGLIEHVDSIINNTNCCIKVYPGEKFIQHDNGHFEIDYTNADHYAELHAALSLRYLTLDGVIHLASFGNAGATRDHISEGIKSQFLLLTAFEQYLNDKDFSFTCVTSEGFKLTANDSVEPAKAMSHALAKSLLAEYPMTNVRAVDFSSSEPLPQIAELLVREISSETSIVFSAYRNRQRFVQTLEQLNDVETAAPLLKAGQRFLVTGGSTGIGYEVIKSIAEDFPSHFIIVGRSDLDSLNPDTNERLQNIERIRRMGSTVEYKMVNVADSPNIDALGELLLSSIGHVDWVIHSAGIVSSWLPLQKQSWSQIQSVLEPKVNGTVNVARLAKKLGARRLVLFSSLNSLVPQKNSMDYAMANAFQDAFASAAPPVKTLSINWPGWLDVGMMKSMGSDSSENNGALKLLTRETGVKVFRKCLESSIPNVAVAELDLGLFRINPFFKIIYEAPKKSEVNVKPVEQKAGQTGGSTVDRLRKIWSDVLKAGEVNATSDFFELGGHSLNGTQVINRIATEFGLQLPFEDIFEYATPASMATYIEAMQAQGKKTDQEAIAPIEEQYYYDLTPGQRSLWIMGQKNEARLAYNMPESYTLKGRFNIAALTRSLELVVARHGILRTVFITVDGEPKQVIKKDSSNCFAFEMTDLSRNSSADAEIKSILDEYVNCPFDLQRGPLFKVKLVRLSDEHHIIICSFHHIVVDAWSLEVIVREIFTSYNSICKQEPVGFKDLEISYKDFTAWLSNHLTSESFSNQKEYWFKEFEVLPDPLNISTDYPRGALKTFGKGNFSFSIDGGIKDSLNQVAREHSASLFMVLLSAVKILLYKFTGQNDIVIGSPISGRNLTSLEDQVGLYVNTLCIRSHIDDKKTFAQVLENVRAKTLLAFENSNYPYDQLVFDLEIKRNASRMPLFDVTLTMLNMQDASDETIELFDLKIERFRENLTLAKFDLNFNFKEKEDELFVNVMYNGDLFSEKRVLSIAGNLSTLLENIVKDPREEIRKLDFLSKDSRRQVLKWSTGKKVTSPKPLLLHQLFERQCKSDPDRIAIVCGEKQLSYGFLNELGDRFANFLIASYSLEKEDTVAILLQKDDSALLCLLGVLKAGAAFIPLDPDQPEERLMKILEGDKPKLLITDSNQMFRIGGSFEGALMAIDLQMDTVFESPTTSAPHPLDPATLAYVIYTSGSTGAPKGVMIEHAGIVNTVSWRKDRYLFDEDTICLQIPSLSYDGSVIDIFSILSSGGKLVIPHREKWKDVNYLNEIVHLCSVTTFIIVPTLYRELLARFKINLPASLKAITCAGERLPANLAADHLSFLPSVELCNEYGPTENSVCSTIAKVTSSNSASKEGTIEIGLPISNTYAYVLDRELNLMPMGSVGEICLAGPGLARGYLNHPEMTQMKFAYLPGTDTRIYRTGDLGRWNIREAIEFVGRADHQMKVRGHRIELSEIEATLRSDVDIDDALVTSFTEEGKEPILIAYIIPLGNYNGTKAKLLLRKRLPEYMIPEHFIIMKKFPVNASGKPDVSRFPTPDINNLTAREEVVLPCSEIEKALLEIWKNVLEKNELGVTDNFYDVGGHSLRGIRIATQIQTALGYKVELADIFAFPTVREMAAKLEGLTYHELPAITALEEQQHYPISPNQHGLWIAAEHGSQSSSYNLPAAFTITGQIDLEILENALHALVQSHEILRTTFISLNGTPRQKIISASSAVVKPTLMHVSDTTAQRELDEILRDLAQRRFPLDEFPLLSAKVLQIAEARSILFLNIHHIIVDAWSMDLLIREFRDAYKALQNKKKVESTPLEIQYKDYSVAEHNGSFGDSAADKLYWNSLAGFKNAAKFPVDFINQTGNTAGTISFAFQADTVEQLKFFGKSQSVTLHTVLITCVKALVRFYAGKDQILTGIPISLRPPGQLDQQIGYYLNTLPIAADFRTCILFVDMVKQVEDTLREASKHQHYPFSKIISDLQLERSIGTVAPLIETLVSWQEKFVKPTGFNGLVLEEFPLPTTSVKFNLEFYFFFDDTTLGCQLLFKKSLYREETIQLMVSRLISLVEAVSNDAGIQIDELDPFKVPADQATVIPDMDL